MRFSVLFIFFSSIIASVISDCSEVSPPLRTVPPELINAFTLNGQIPIRYHYFNDAYSSEEPLVYTHERVQHLIANAKARQTMYYGQTDKYLYQALDQYLDRIEGKSVAVIGSVVPWYESILISYGALPTTIEYNRIISEDPRLKVLTVQEHEENPQQYDAVLSISSFEHDGLGRYGDPIDPDGDLKAMEKVRHMLKEGGILFLAVPVGQDYLVWNACRIYGQLRLKALLEGWEIIGSYGYSPDNLEDRESSWYHQPVFVLKPKKYFKPE